MAKTQQRQGKIIPTWAMPLGSPSVIP